jgi:hypothetical protein
LSHTEDPADAASRLQAALDRIARLARPAAVQAEAPAQAAQTAAVAARLDALIEQLRAALANSP